MILEIPKPRTKKDYDVRVVGFGLDRKDDVVSLFQPTDIEVLSRSTVGGKEIAERLLISGVDSTFTRLTRVENRQKLSLLREIGGLRRFFAKRFAGGDVIMFRGLGTVNDATPMYYDYFIVD